jgi:hypothetical protein
MPKILTIGSVLALALAFASIASAAVISPSYQAVGFEIGAPQGDVSPFAGFATGTTGDRAQWRAGIAHAPLAGCTTVGSSCAVTGGTLTLTSNNGASLAGTVTGGGLTLTAQAPRCGTQTFAVVVNVTSASGAEQFTGVLTHYRFQFRGTCTVLAATVQGTLAAVAGDDGNTF